MNKMARKIIILTLVATFSVTTLAFAGWGQGYGHMMGPGNSGSGWNDRSGYGYNQGGNYGNLSSGEIAILDQKRAEFFKATKNARQKLYEKELALRSELAKEDPDTGMASDLQNEISILQSDLDQKRLDYEIQVRKTVPNYNRGSSRYGSMMGSGPRGGGYCMR